MLSVATRISFIWEMLVKEDRLMLTNLQTPEGRWHQNESALICWINIPQFYSYPIKLPLKRTNIQAVSHPPLFRNLSE
jgi:hypothetical protein